MEGLGNAPHPSVIQEYSIGRPIEREASARVVELLYIRDNLLSKGDIHKGLTTVEANVYILVM